MNYDDVAAVYLRNAPTSPARPPTVPDTPARRLRDAVEPIATQGWWAREVHDRSAALGLDFFQAYAWGRAASLGEPVAAVVVSSFGVFEAGFLTSVYESARGIAARDAVLAARADGASAGLARFLEPGDEGPWIDRLLEAVVDLDRCARPLYSGLAALPVPDGAAGRLWRAAELLREHRGDAHLAACLAADLDAVAMNVLTERWLGFPVGAYSGTRGFSADAIAGAVAALGERGWMAGEDLTDEGRRARDGIETATDAAEASLVRAVGDDLDAVVAAAERISARIVAGGAFPHDPAKRAAG